MRGATVNVHDGECVAVVGPNGCGKSSLLKTVAGIETLDDGEIRIPNRMSVGYLPQEANLDVDRSLQDELLTAFTEVQAALIEMTDLEKKMVETDPASEEHARVLERYAECSHIVEHQDGYSLEARTRRVAAGLGFVMDDMSRPCKEFSGGWQMRILLARLLLRKPDIILLDEPTNHLDLESTLWLEQWIQDCGRTVMLVSHERATMDRLANRIICLDRGKAEIYPGDYSKYLALSEKKRNDEWNAYQRQQKEITAMEKFIRRFRATASRAALVQSRIKQLDKIERIEPPFHPTAIHFSFPRAPRSYQDVVKLKSLGHSYGDIKVFSSLDLTISRGEKIGLVGVNGAGKSTLLRIMAGRETAAEGECRTGKNVRTTYFEQYDTSTLNSDVSLLRSIESTAPRSEVGRARDLLGAFLFSGDDVDKPLRALSGGERTRFRMARILFSPANLLLLDEPTNHLDVSSRATVEKALQNYSGTLVIVSHDRVFMDRVTTKIVEIENGSIRVYPGTYSDYFAYKRKTMADENTSEKTVPRNVEKEQRIREREAKKARDRKLRAIDRDIDAVETSITDHEKRTAELEMKMADPEIAADYDALSPISQEHRLLTQEHERLLKEWETLHQTREEIEPND